MDSNLNNYNSNLNSDESRADLNSLITNDQETLLSSSSQYQMSNNPEKKATHSEIEKRRRQKMNKHLNELVFHLPITMNKNKKPDKITILKMAVQHMKNLKASSSILSDSFLCQNYITPFELQSLVLKESEEFLLVIKCDSSRILYASESCSNCIGFPSNELVDKVFFEIVHPSDSKQVKDQITYYDLNNSMGSVSNYMLNKTKTYSTGDRRSFICRIRSGPYQDGRQPLDHIYTNMENKKSDYKTVHFVGYLRSDLSSNLKFSPDSHSETSVQNLLSPNISTSNESSSYMTNLNSTNSTKLNSFKNFHSITLINESSNLNNEIINTTIPTNTDNTSQQVAQTSSSLSPNSNTAILEYYLILYGQINHKTEEPAKYKYVSRHDQDGKFVYLEPGVHSLIGYLPHQLISESLFNHVHIDDVNSLKKAFQEITTNSSKNKIRTHEYRFRLENKTYITMESVLYSLQNPFNGQLEYIVAQNTLRSTPVSMLQNQKPTLPQTSPQVYQKASYLQQTSIQNLSSQNLSLPMTPSPEENIYSNENNSEKLNNSNSNINLNEYLNTSKNMPNYQQMNLNQKSAIMSPNLFNRSIPQHSQQQFRQFNQVNQVVYQNQAQKQNINAYPIYNQQQLNQPQMQQSNESKINQMYQMIDTNSFANSFINSESDYDLNNRMFNQQQTLQNQSTNADDSNNWMMQLFDNNDSNSNQDLNFKKS